MDTDDTDHTANVDTMCGLALDKLAAAQREMAAARDAIFQIACRRAQAVVGLSPTDYEDAQDGTQVVLREIRGVERVIEMYRQELTAAGILAAAEGAAPASTRTPRRPRSRRTSPRRARIPARTRKPGGYRWLLHSGRSGPMADVLLETRDGWIELIEYLAQQSPLEERHVSEAMTLFAVPFQGQAWQRVHGLWVASGRRWDNPGEGWSREVERFVVDLLHVIAPPQTSCSPTTAGEGVTGTGEGHTAVPVTPAGVYMEDGMPVAWVADPHPGGVVCAVADPTSSDGLCGIPTEDVPCTVHYPEAGDE